MRRSILLLIAALWTVPALGQAEDAGLVPGTTYREYPIRMSSGNLWRITDPGAVEAFGDRAREFLPNPVIEFDISDLDGASRAEIVIDRWAGHTGTSQKQFRINGNAWIGLAELTTTPTDPLCYMYQDNPTVEVPLAQLQEGANTLEGFSGPQTCHSFGWGQWGWYGGALRVYYNDGKDDASVEILSPTADATLDEFPRIEIAADAWRGVQKIEVYARYRGFDADGDGHWTEWQRHYQSADVTGHVGTILGPTRQSEPYVLMWDTRQVPDQSDVQLIARVQDGYGVWTVSEIVDGLTLDRPGADVALYASNDIPENFWVRDHQVKSATIVLPDDYDASQTEWVTVHLRAWNGDDHGESTQIQINDWHGTISGVDHQYNYSVQRIPPDALKPGVNTLTFTSVTHHHGVELLWPGPALIVRTAE
ncbi:MAG: hypothetical protein RhofKO_21780 [Rhodothermales bacterium]